MKLRTFIGAAIAASAVAVVPAQATEGQTSNCSFCEVVHTHQHREWQRLTYPDGRAAWRSRLKVVTVTVCDGKVTEDVTRTGWTAPAAHR